MAFIRKKGTRFYVVHNERRDGKVKQTILACLGRYPSVSHAIEKRKEQAVKFEHLGKECIEERNEGRHARYWQKVGEEQLRWAIQERGEIQRLEKLPPICTEGWEDELAAALQQDEETTAMTLQFVRALAGEDVVPAEQGNLNYAGTTDVEWYGS